MALYSQVETAHGEKYRRQLAKHFAHKVAVFEDEHGSVVRFSCGTAIMTNDETALIIEARSETEDGQRETAGVIERHLIRFAFREEISALQWEERTQSAPLPNPAWTEFVETTA